MRRQLSHHWAHKLFRPSWIATRRLSRRLVVCALLTAGTAALAAGGAATQATAPRSFDHEGLARQAMELHIRPLYADLVSAADRLRRTLEGACQHRDGEALGGVKTAYRDLLVAWSRTEHLRFGPVVDANRFERVMYWPDRQRIGERQVAQLLSKADPAAIAVGELAKKSVALQGVGALEIVLYGKDGGGLLDDTASAKFACTYATVIAGNISQIAGDMVAEWADGGRFAGLWLKPGEQNPVYRTSTDTTIELLKAFRAGIYNPRDLKLLPALGLKRIAVRGQLAPKSRPPFELSGLGLAAMIANTEGALHLYVSGGLAERLAAIEPAAAALLRSNLERAIRDMREVEPAGLAAFSEQALMDKLALVRDPLAAVLSDGASALAEVAGVGALVLGFTDDDGD
jgi:uncharacterized protein